MLGRGRRTFICAFGERQVEWSYKQLAQEAKMFASLTRQENDKLFDILVSGQRHTLKLANFAAESHAGDKFNALMAVNDDAHELLNDLAAAYQQTFSLAN
jgi:hypothetical protein